MRPTSDQTLNFQLLPDNLKQDHKIPRRNRASSCGIVLNRGLIRCEEIQISQKLKEWINFEKRFKNPPLRHASQDSCAANQI
ncbi:hypothetical protein BTJ40_14530 [Microbulbifer sp. A4B17]|nr:hypothetical protein BTJ40_14530 [Microbulbifer sp. A4B17]